MPAVPGRAAEGSRDRIRYWLTRSAMPIAPNKIPDNIEFAAQELLEAPVDERPAMFENIAKAANQALA
jgi:hypothetical protein